jgi:heat shock protein HslJ
VSGSGPLGSVGTSWALDWADSTITSQVVVAVTLRLESDALSGAGPCNRYRASLSVADDGAVEIDPIARTLMLCEPPLMSAEEAYLDALGAVDHVEVEGDRLVLSNGQGVRLSFTPSAGRGLLVGAWRIVNVATAHAIGGVIDGTDPAVIFDGDGSVTVTTGCNTGSSAWDLTDDRITIAPVRLTRRHCDEPPGVMRQEAEIVRALGSSQRMEITPVRLVLLRADGGIALVADAEAVRDR